MQTKQEQSESRAPVLQPLVTGISSIPYWISAAFLFLIVHTTHEQVTSVLAFLESFAIGPDPHTPLSFLSEKLIPSLWYLPSVMGILFLGSATVLIIPVVVDGRRILQYQSKGPAQIFRTYVVPVGIAFFMAALVFHLGNASMGAGYAARSLTPFLQESGWYHKRLLMPVLAHVLFFRGDWLYYGFSILVFVMFLVIATAWVRDHAPLPAWQLLSLFTCSFAIFALQFPGYPDILAFTFFVLVMSGKFGQRARLSLLVFALLTHEATLFIGVLLAWFYLDRLHFFAYLSLLGLYGVLWAGAFSFQAEGLLVSHDIYGRPAIDWAISNYRDYLLGVFISFKAIWLLVPISLVVTLRAQQHRHAFFIFSSICTGLFLTLLGLDTSRMMGFAFPGVLVAIQSIRSHMKPAHANRILKVVFAVNLLIPSFYVGTNTGIVLRPGLYGYVLKSILQISGNGMY